MLENRQKRDNDVSNSNATKKRRNMDGFGIETSQDEDSIMASPGPTRMETSSESNRKENRFRKRRRIDYLDQRKELNRSFMEHIRKKNLKVIQALEKGTLTPDQCPFFYEEIEQYKSHVEQLNKVYLREECSLFTFGSGDCGQLALGDHRLDASKPAQVKTIPKNVTVLACGGLHSAIVSADNTVYTWGCNDDGALGLNPYGKKEGIATAFSPQKVNFLCPKLLDKRNPPANDPIKWVATGDSHTLALSCNGSVYMFGAYKDKEGRSWRDMPPDDWPKSDLEETENLPPAPKGTQTFPVPVILLGDRSVDMIACGCSFNAAILKEDQTLVTWGVGECGELGRPTQEIRRKDGSYDMDRIRSQYLTPRPVRWPGGVEIKVEYVACGGYHTLAITEGLRVATTGLNNYGQLGLGDEEPRDCLTFVEALDDAKVKAVDGGAHHSLCLAGNGRMIAFGRSDSGQLGITDTIPPPGKFENIPVEVLLPGDSTENTDPTEPVAQISCGSNHNLAITESGNLYTWGYGDMGALGHGEEKDDFRPRKMKMKGEWEVHAAVGGGQHSALLCAKKD